LNGEKLTLAGQLLAFIRFAAGPVFAGLTFYFIYKILKKAGKDTKISSFLRNFIKTGKNLFAGMMSRFRLRKWFAASSRRIKKAKKNGYEEEIEKLMTWRDLGRNYADRLREWFAKMMEREKKWSDLETDAERVRFLYRRMLINAVMKGFMFNRADTPRETIQGIAVYKNRDKLKEMLPEKEHLRERHRSRRYEMYDRETMYENLMEQYRKGIFRDGAKIIVEAMMQPSYKAAVLYEKCRYGDSGDAGAVIGDSGIQEARNIFGHELKL